MSTDSFYASQGLKVANPENLWGASRMLLAVITFAVCGASLLNTVDVVRDLLASGGDLIEHAPVTSGSRLALGVLAFFVGLGSFARFGQGFSRVGRLMVPARAPADFGNVTTDLCAPLQRGEMPAYSLHHKEASLLGLATRFFPNRAQFMTRSMKRFVHLGVEGFKGSLWWVLFLAAVWGALSFVPDSAFAGYAKLVPPVPYTFGIAVVIAGGLRIALLMPMLPSAGPRADALEFHASIEGGGDPNRIPHGLEHALLAIRTNEGTPNRVVRSGFGNLAGGVQNTGTFAGQIVVEAQPEILASTGGWALSALILAGTAFQVLALTIAFSMPDYMGADGFAPAGIALLFGRWMLRLIGALVISSFGAGLVEQGRSLLGTYRFRSVATVLDVDGNYAASTIRVGKAITDSIESENTTVRSDCSVTGHSSTILSESMGLEAPRSVVGMIVDDAARNVQFVVDSFLHEFQSRGTAIAGVDLSNESVGAVAQANLALSGQREMAKVAGRRQAALAAPEAMKPAGLLGQGSGPPAGPTPRPLLDEDGLEEWELPPDDGIPVPHSLVAEARNTKDCPDCAESIKFAARRCRFCGYRFDGGVSPQ